MQTTAELNSIPSGPFLFVSYTHENKGFVHHAVDILMQQGVRIWIDRERIHSGDWFEKVQQAIDHDFCMGVIFFNSTHSFISDPVSRERLYCLQKSKERKAQKKPFAIYIVNLERPTTMRLLKKTFEMLPDNDKEIAACINSQKLHVILELFHENMMREHPEMTAEDDCVLKLYGHISEELSQVINQGDVLVKQLRQKRGVNSVGKTFSVSIGGYKGASVEDLPRFLLKKPTGRYSFGDSEYIIVDGVAYSIVPLTWVYLYNENETAFFLCTQLLEFRKGGCELQAWLGKEFADIGFDATERDTLIAPPRLLRPEEIQLILDTSILRMKFSADIDERRWWVDKFTGALQQVIREDGKVYERGYNSGSRSGVRPVIGIPLDKLSKIIKE